MFEAVSALSMLESAWLRVLENGGAAGGDGETVGEFQSQCASRLLGLHQQLRSGRWHPGANRVLTIPKRSGGVRPLSIPCVSDRIVHTALSMALMPVVDSQMADGSYGYRPGRSVRQAVARIEYLRDAGYGWVVDADIERYFERIPHDGLMECLGNFVKDSDVLQLIEQILIAGAQDGRGLAQGSPLSPLLSNLYLDSFDDQFADGAIRLIRFADDFVLLCRSEDQAHQALPQVAAILQQRGLSLNMEKTRIVDFAEGFRFLGHLFVRSLAMKVDQDQDGAEDGGARLLRMIADDDARALHLRAENDAQEQAGWRENQRVLYVHHGSRRLGLRNQSLTVQEDGHELIALPTDRITRIDLGPQADADPFALRQALSAGITVQFVDGDGATQGTLAPPNYHRAGLHLDQARLVLDPDKRAALARVLVAGRIHNQRAVLRRLSTPPRDRTIEDALAGLNQAYRQLKRPSTDIASLMGTEGQAASLYWPCLGKMLKHGWQFSKRIRRPPPDPVNAVLSLTAHMLTRDVESLITRHGLHPGFGVLHGTRDGHFGCVYDVVEEFRAPLAEALTIYLFNNRMLQPGDFQQANETTGVRLTGDARRTVIRTYEQWLDRPIKCPRQGHKIVWRRMMELQVLAYADHCRGLTEYAPYRMDY